MEKIKRHVHWESINGEPIYSGDTTVIPVAKVFAVNTRFFNFVWNRPHAIQVQDGEKTTTIPIANVNRLAQIAIYGFGATLAAVLWLFSQKPAK